MGLDLSHGAWHGAYSAFNRWRSEIARLAGIPLGLVEGFYDGGPPDEAMTWAGPPSCGPLCKSHLGPLLVRWIEDAAEWLPVKWEALKPDPLHVLLNHSDCDGEIAPADCGPIADRLQELLPLLPTEEDPGHIGNWTEKTQKFIDGLRLAATRGEPITFG